MDPKNDTTDIRSQIQAGVNENGHLTCTAAHRLAQELGLEPLFVGEQATRIGIRITRCQLGFFGYAEQKGMPGYKIVKKLESVPEATAHAVRQATKEGKITCADLWHIAQEQRISRLDIGNVAETLGFKTHRCQLGCF